MAYVIKKRGRYLEGHSYGTGVGYSFSWTAEFAKALRIADDDPSTDFFSNSTHGKIVRIDNTKKELKALGRRALAEKGERNA